MSEMTIEGRIEHALNMAIPALEKCVAELRRQINAQNQPTEPEKKPEHSPLPWKACTSLITGEHSLWTVPQPGGESELICRDVRSFDDAKLIERSVNGRTRLRTSVEELLCLAKGTVAWYRHEQRPFILALEQAVKRVEEALK